MGLEYLMSTLLVVFFHLFSLLFYLISQMRSSYVVLKCAPLQPNSPD